MKVAALLLIASIGGGAWAQSAGPMLTRYAADQLGGIATVLRYTVARPDRAEIQYHFLTAAPRALPEEVQVLDPGGEIVRLSDQQGADCTLSRVEIVTGRAPAVVHAVRVYSPGEDDQSAPAPMDVQRYRPVPGGDVGQSPIQLRAVGAPVRTGPLCRLADVRRAMMRR